MKAPLSGQADGDSALNLNSHSDFKVDQAVGPDREVLFSLLLTISRVSRCLEPAD